ncbi:MAG: hypothetical protein OXF03_00315 [Gammaproteobacteria bacterium]|nr:hypothetical protein [Gammaproteobacteria bacterium]
MKSSFEFLRPEAAFARRTEQVRSFLPAASGNEICAALMKKHCAGMQGFPAALCESEAKGALAAPPGQHRLSGAVQWMLNSVTPPELSMLVFDGGVEPAALAAHVRVHPVSLAELVPFLNIFAEADGFSPVLIPARYLHSGDTLPDARVWPFG